MEIQTYENDDFPTFDLEIGATNLPYCRYLDIVNEPFYEWMNNVSISLCNIRSCRKNFLDFICYFSNVLFNYSCIVLVKTWLTQEYENVFFINGYKSFDVFRNNYGGGIRLYVKESINVSILQQFTITNDVIELLTAEICTLDNKFLLCCVYHPPSSEHGFNYEFIEQFRQTLTLLRSMSIPIVVGRWCQS